MEILEILRWLQIFSSVALIGIPLAIPTLKNKLKLKHFLYCFFVPIVSYCFSFFYIPALLSMIGVIGSEYSFFGLGALNTQDMQILWIVTLLVYIPLGAQRLQQKTNAKTKTSISSILFSSQ